MSDFFGEYVAPGMLATGVGMSGVRALRDINAAGTVTRRWDAQKSTETFLAAVKEAREGRYEMTAADLTREMWLDTGRRYSSPEASSFFSNPDVKEAFGAGRDRATRSLIKNFGLHDAARRLGITSDPSTITGGPDGSFRKLLDISPKHVRHVEKVARSFGMLSLTNIDTTDPLTSRALSQRAESSAASIIRSNEAFKTTQTVGELMKADEALNNALSASNRSRSVRISGIDQIQELMGGLNRADRGDLVSMTHELFEEASKMNMSMRLQYLQQGGREIISGVRIKSNVPYSSPIDVPLVQENGSVRLGYYGQDRGYARRVLTENASRFAAGERVPIESLTESLDVALLRGVKEKLSAGKLTSESHREFMRGIQTSYHDEVGGLIISDSANPMLNKKHASQFRFKGSPLGESLTDTGIKAINERAHELGLSFTTGISPSQEVAGVGILPSDRTIGTGAFGGLVGDNKTVSQATRGTVVSSRNRGVTAIQGMLQEQMGDVRNYNRTAAAPEGIMRAMLRGSSRPDIGLHEDVNILIDDNIRIKAHKTVRIQGDSPVTEFLSELLTGDESELARRSASRTDGISGTIARHEARLAEDLPDGLRTRLQEQLKALREGRQIGPDVIVGELAEGGLQHASKVGTFNLDRMDYVKRRGGPGEDRVGELVLRGHTEEELTVGSKMFDQKRVAGAQLGRSEGRFMAALSIAAPWEDTAEGHQKYTAALEEFRIGHAEEWMKNPDGRAPLLHKFKPKGVKRGAWESALRQARGVQTLETQGLKKIGSKSLAKTAEVLASELATEHTNLTRELASIGEEEFAPGATEYPGRDKVRTKVIKRQAERAAIEDALSRSGVTFQDGRFVVDETKTNIVESFEQLLEETMHEGTHHKVRRWSAKQLFTDMSVNEEMFDEASRAMFKAKANLSAGERRAEALKMLRGEEGMRNKMLASLQGQMQYGVMNMSFSANQSPTLTVGSGKAGSFNLPMMKHMQAQGGVMADLGIEFAGRLTGDKTAEAKDVYKRMGAFYKGVGESAAKSTIDMKAFGKAFGGPGDTVLSSLFGRNQKERSNAFEVVRKKFGVNTSGHLLFDLGDGRQIFHPEGISTHTGGFRTAGGDITTSPIDKATKNIAKAHWDDKVDDVAKGVAAYDEGVQDIILGKKQAPSAMYSGKLQGSLRQQARAQIADDVLEFMGKEFTHKVGIRESQFERILGEMGAVGGGQLDERMTALRQGKAAGVVARQPGTELHRISSVEMFSVDEAMRRYTSQRMSGLSASEISREFFSLDKSRHDTARKALLEGGDLWDEFHQQAIREARGRRIGFEEDLKTLKESGRKRKGGKKRSSKSITKERNRIHKQIKAIDDGSWAAKQANIQAETLKGSADYWKGQYTEGLLSQYDKHALWLPKQMEQILGADFDDDQLDLILGKDRSGVSRLRERAGFMGEMLTEGATAEEAIARATTTEQKLAAEDYVYKIRQRELYKGLKDRDIPALTRADVTRGSPAWKKQQAGMAMMAEMEKGYIGSMTNATDFVREHLRATTTGQKAEGRLFTEMLLGIMPETALKAKQAGAGGLMEYREKFKESIGESIDQMHDILTGRGVGKLSRQEQIDTMTNAFKNIHDPRGASKLVPKLLEYIPQVIDAVIANPGNEDENIITKTLKKREGVDMMRLTDRVLDATTPSPHSAFGRKAMEEIGIQGPGATKSHLKTAAGTFKDLLSAVKRHKRPALIGAAAAVATSLLLSSPGNVTAEMANEAGARHSAGRPTEDGPGFGESAPVSAGPGRSIRISGRTNGDIDTSAATRMMQERFPGANVSYTMNDYRERINEEYLRKRLNR
jgi:hypothetical protein